MRQIILLLLIFFHQVVSASPKLEMGYGMGSTLGNTYEWVNSGTQKLKSSQVYIGYKSKKYLREALTFNLRYNQVSEDYQSYFIRGEQGQVTALSDTFQDDIKTASTSLNYAITTWQFNLSHSRPLTSNPLSTTTYSGEVIKKFNTTGTTAKYQYALKNSDRPLSYATSPETFRSTALATTTRQSNHQLTVEQIISENIKIHSVVKLGEQNVDRPLHKGFGAGVTAGFWNKYAVYAHLENIKENNDYLPPDGSGYFKLNSREISLSREINYTHLVTLSYAQIIEKETPRGVLPERTFGTDVAGLSLKLSFHPVSLRLKGQYERSNSRREAFQTLGAVEWEI